MKLILATLDLILIFKENKNNDVTKNLTVRIPFLEIKFTKVMFINKFLNE
jgi:hypothetical protein